MLFGQGYVKKKEIDILKYFPQGKYEKLIVMTYGWIDLVLIIMNTW